MELVLPVGAVATFGLLTAALCALWIPRRGPGDRLLPPLWVWCALGAVAVGLASDFLEWPALLFLAALAAAVWALDGSGLSAPLRWIAGAAVLALSVAAMVHVLPGFSNPKVISEAVLKSDAIPYSKHLNFDKGAMGLLLLGLGSARIGSVEEWKRTAVALLPVLGATLAAVLVLSIGLGYVRFDPSPPAGPIVGVWIWTNLFFTCVAEEALFRGVVQRRLESALGRFAWHRSAALVGASALFGLAHFGGGWSYVALSTIAGLGYGHAMQRSGRIEAAILTHFGVNLVHLTLFTYPALASAPGL